MWGCEAGHSSSQYLASLVQPSNASYRHTAVLLTTSVPALEPNRTAAPGTAS
jgi:hypothetical protein